MIDYLAVLVVAAVISFACTPLAKKIAYNVGAIDVPKDERRVHQKPIPRLGGLAIFISFTLCSLYFLKLDKHIIGMLFGATIIVAMGIVDDTKPLKPLHKLLFQIAAAVVLIVFDVTVKNITVPFAQVNESAYVGYFGIPITILWVVGITNAVNLIDGLDGLACGISLISALTLFGVAIISEREIAVMLTAILAGACLGFLPFNFNPASIFLGDTGAQFLGFILAAISISGAIKSATAVVVAVPILALGLPIYDTLFAMVRRKINNRPIMEADRGHLHHRLLDLGLNQRQVVFIMYSISAILGTTSIVAMVLSTKKSFALLIVICSVILSMAIELGLFNRKNKTQ
jgi:UDP-GlcNAc:undecaprenyl-phosphate/decaprenyl-phosphate GlcNAc-1-phosphate transferase